ncbi:MAG: hypothetical protein N2170_05905 [Bacteroidia bacterium]|nr:hypothetical protein [Bacteroidia bacterium]
MEAGHPYLWAKMLFIGMVLAQGEVALPSSCTHFAVDGLYHLYVWSEGERALYKLWAPRYDSLSRIGGAPGEEGFLGVSSIAPVGNQQVYILDAAGQKIALLGTNLQPLQQLSYAQLPREVAEGYPTLLTVGGAGELYLLLRETQEIVKVDPFGRVLLRFGGKVYGPGRIIGAAFLYAEAGRLYLIDTILRQVSTYDSWGNFLEAFPFPPQAKDGRAFAQGKAFWRENVLWWYTSSAPLQEITLPAAPQEVWVRGDRLYWAAGRRLGWLPLP